MSDAEKPGQLRPQLRRDLGLPDAIAIGLGAVIGAGLFVVTGVAASVAGPALILGLILAGLAALCNALSSAELAARYPESGGTYEYGYQVLHPLLGFAAGWMFLVSKLAAGGTVALGFGAYFAALVPAVPSRWAAVAAALLLTAANWFGIKKAGRLNTLIVSMTVLVLVGFVLAGLPAFQTGHWQPFAPHGWVGVAEAAALLFFAYTGFARLATLGEEVREPRRIIPRAIILTLAISAALYLAVVAVALGAVGAGALAESSSPLQRAAEVFPFHGAVWVWVTGVGAVSAMLGVMLSQIMGISRMLFAMARRRDLPRLLEHVHPRYGVPDYGLALGGLVVTAVAAFGGLHAVVSAAAFTILLYYSITNLAALRLPRQDKLVPRWVAVLGLLGCLALTISLQWKTVLVGGGLLVGGLVLRWLFRPVSRTVA
jgi:APA family basic amino acid/polyamine antiporter